MRLNNGILALAAQTWHPNDTGSPRPIDRQGAEPSRAAVGDVPDELDREKGSERRRHGARKSFQLFISIRMYPYNLFVSSQIGGNNLLHVWDSETLPRRTVTTRRRGSAHSACIVGGSDSVSLGTSGTSSHRRGREYLRVLL